MTARFLAVGLLAAFVFPVGCSKDPASQAKRLVEVGNRYYQAGKYAQASIVYRRAIQKQPRYGEAYYWLGLTEIKRNNNGAAIASLHRAFDLPGPGYDAYEPLAELLLRLLHLDRLAAKRVSKALTDLNLREEQRNPGSLHLPRIRGEIALLEGKPDEAAKWFRLAISRDPSRFETAAPLFQALVAAEKLPEAEALAEAMLSQHKDFDVLYERLSTVYERQGRWADVERIRKAHVEHLPAKISPRLALARFYLRQGRRPEGMAVLQAVLDNPKEFQGGRYQVGQFYVQWLDIPRGIELYREGMKLEPQRREQYQEKIIEAYLRQGKFDESLKLIEDLVRDFPNSAHARAIRGSMRLAKEPQAGLEDLRFAVRAAPDNGIFRYTLGEAERNFGTTKDAEIQLTEAVNRLPEETFPKLSLGAVYLATKNYGRAFQLALQVLAADPNNIGAGQIRATVWLEMNLFREARSEIERIEKIAPHDPETLRLRARLELAEGKSREAEATLRKLHKEYPNDPRNLRGLVNLYSAQGRGQDATVLLKEEVNAAPDRLDLRLMLSEVALRSGDLSVAAEHAQYVAQKKSGSADSWAALGRVLYHRGQYPEAEQHFRKSLAMDKENLSANLHLGAILAHSGRLKESIPFLDQALKQSPDEVTALNNIAFAMVETGGDLDRALGFAQRAVARAPHDTSINDTLGWVYLKKKLYSEAVTVFRKNAEKEPANPTWRYHLALAMIGLGNKDAARVELQAALKSKPSSREKTEIEELLARSGS